MSSDSDPLSSLGVTDPSWDMLRALLDRMGRPEPWTTGGHWAIDQLRAVLGEAWPAKAARDEVPPWPGLAAIGSQTLGFADALEWALRLRLTGDVEGSADVRRDLARDVTVGRALHSGLQLEVAGLARRLGWGVRLEPSNAATPGDVALETPTAGTIVVETRALTEKLRTRAERAAISRLTDHLTLAARARGLWLAGQILRMPTPEEVGKIERWVAAADGPGRLAGVDDVSLYLVRRDDAVGHALRSPAVTDELLPRMAGVMAAKTRQMRGSGAGWLRMTAFTGLWPFTQWGRAPLADKLPSMAGALRATLGGHVPDGIVLSSAAGLGGGTPDETVAAPQGTAVRRLIAPARARETLIMPFSRRGHDTAAYWLELADAEQDWLDWALVDAGLRPLAETFALDAPPG